MGGIKCDLCGRRLRTRYNLRIHMAVHTGAKPYTCNICGKGFQQKWNMITHTSRVHSGDKPFQCQDCGRAFGYASHFKAHVKIHFLQQLDVPDNVKAQMLQPYACAQCTKRFETPRLLEEHLSLHSGDNLFTCDTCGKHFSSRRHIVKHFQRRCNNSDIQRNKQSCGTDPTPCEICGKVVARHSIPKHLNIHTRRRTYPCNVCQRTFLESGQLAVHARVHSGVKPHVCEVCGRAHAQLGNLLAHRRRHHGLTDKPVRISKEIANYIEKGNDDSVIPDDKTLSCEEQRASVNTENEFKKVDARRTGTGSETIHDFLKIAQLWITERLEESKADRNSNEQEGKSITPPPAVEGSISEDDNETVNPVETGVTMSSLDTEPYDEKEGLLKRLMAEIGENAKVKALLIKGRKKKKKDIMMWILRRVGDNLPTNSIVDKGRDGSYLWHCWDCSVTQKSRPLFLRHRLVHAPPHMRPHSCDTCGRTFTQAGNLKHHLLVHRQEHRFFCEICGSGFRHKSHFNTHRKRHDDPTPTQTRFQCDTCGKSCLTKFHLVEHIRTHTKERPYLCRTCGRQFGASSTYNRHLSGHDGEKEPCTTCGKLFADSSSRRRHQAGHRVLRPEHACICGKTFTQKASLNRHAPICPVAPEPALRQHRCLVCPKTFLDASSLKRHSASHDPTRRFCCAVCNLMLKTKDTLTRHMTRHRISE